MGKRPIPPELIVCSIVVFHLMNVVHYYGCLLTIPDTETVQLIN